MRRDSVADLDRNRAQRLMTGAGLDALILLSPESFAYATGAVAVAVLVREVHRGSRRRRSMPQGSRATPVVTMVMALAPGRGPGNGPSSRRTAMFSPNRAWFWPLNARSI